MTPEQASIFIREWGDFTKTEVKEYPYCYVDVLTMIQEAHHNGYRQGFDEGRTVKALSRSPTIKEKE